MMALLTVAIALPWLVIALLLLSRNAPSRNSGTTPIDRTAQPDVPVRSPGNAVQDSDPVPQEWIPGKKGPWGRIDTMLFAIDVPDGLVVVPPADQPPVHWSFPGYTKEKVLATLRLAGISQDEVNQLDGSGRWSSTDGVTAVEPGDRLILSLSPEVRAKLYAILVELPQNAQKIDPVWFRPGKVDWRLQDSGLAPESIALLNRLLYPQGENYLLFADFEPALRSLPDDAERRRFLKAILRKRAVLARLRLDADADVEKISQYWGVGGRRKDLFPFLSALHRVEKGCNVNLVYLLPDFARERLYRHPTAVVDDKGVKQDCFWSAYNFFNDPPDNSREDTHSLVGLNRDYYRITIPTQLGDLLILTVGDGVPIHAAVFLADDIYFTKNGVNASQPWILMHLADLLETYQVQHTGHPLAGHPLAGGGSLGIHYFRRKGL
jgi:hypothetical protein